MNPDGVLLTSKVAIVTGGGQGIGQGICLVYAAFGAHVLAVDKDKVRAEETAREACAQGRRCVPYVADVTDHDQVATMVQAAVKEYGQVDILVNNVGDFHTPRVSSPAPFIQGHPDDWDDLYRLNLRHIFSCSQSVGRRMVEQGKGGSIINLSSSESFRAAPGLAAYCAFKTAVNGFTRSLAVELAPHRIRVNAIAPDKIETPQVDYRKRFTPEQWSLWPIWVPLGHHGLPEDVAGAAVFLASELSRFITGTTIHVDGGTIAASGWFKSLQGGWTNSPLST
ncbi:MAG: SDR family oxidoreductase [Chloroflexi bacterium]|nr:SDR family oxidoreductase [Chloroflexota bacterium]